MFDLSSDTIRHAIWQIEMEWDPDVEDEWMLPKVSRSIFVKIAGYEQKKYEKVVVLFELVIGVTEVGKTL